MLKVKVWAMIELTAILLSLALYSVALTSASTNSSYPPEITLLGYVKYTILLYNSTLVEGNGVFTGNGGNPVSVAYDPKNGLVYVATTNGVVSVVNVSSKRVVDTISLGGPLRGLATSIIYVPSNGLIYVGSAFPDAVYVIDPSTNKVVDKIVLGPIPPNVTIGPIPLGMAFDPKNGLLYVASSFTDSVIAINTVNNSVVANITVGKYPVSLAYDPNNGLLFVANYKSGSISVIDTSTNKVVATIDVAHYLSSVVYDPKTGYLYASLLNLTAGNLEGRIGLFVVDPTTGHIIANVTSIRGFVVAMVYDPLTNDIYLSCYSGITVFDPENNSVIGQISGVITGPNGLNYGRLIETYGMALDPSGNYLYVADFNLGALSVVDLMTGTVVANITVSTRPIDVSYDPLTDRLYVVDIYGTMYMVNPNNNEVIKEVHIPVPISGITYDPRDGYLYATSNFAEMNHSYIFIIDPESASITGWIQVSPPILGTGIAYDPRNGYLYITSFPSSKVYVVNPVNGSIVATIGVGPRPNGIAYDPENGYIYVAVTGSDTLSVIDPANNSVIANIAVKTPYGVAYDPKTGYLYVTSGYSNSVLVIDPANLSIIGNFSVGLEPTGITYDPKNGYIYVANFLSGSLSVVQVNVTAYAVAFSEKGLPPGTKWSVTLNGVTKTSNTSTIVFYELNGTYAFNVSPIEGYNVSPASGTVTVNGKPVEVGISFEQPVTTSTTTTTTTSTTASVATTIITLTTTTTSTIMTSETSTVTPTTPTTSSTLVTTNPSQTPLTDYVVVVVVIVIAVAAAILLKLRR